MARQSSGGGEDVGLPDSRSGRIVVVSHCLLNVHSLEDGLAEFPGCEEDLVRILLEGGVGIFQLPCPEMEISHISRAPLPKESYEHPRIRERYRSLARRIASRLEQFAGKGYRIVAVVGAEASPTCGISLVGRWKDPKRKGRFPDDVEFVEGMGVFMEEFRRELEERGIRTEWVGLPGKSLKSIHPHMYAEALDRISRLVKGGQPARSHRAGEKKAIFP